MKKNLLIGILAGTCLLASCIEDDAQKASPIAHDDAHEQTAAPAALSDSANYTSIQWIDSVKEMGSIREGQKMEVSFRFRNTGSKPLVIANAQPSCGCTVPEKPEKPVMPGEEGLIKAVFDSEGRSGTNHKTITVTANTTGTTSHVLEFNVNVLGKDKAPQAASAQPATPGF